MVIVQQSCKSGTGITPVKIANVLVQDLKDDHYGAISAFWPTKVKRVTATMGYSPGKEEKDKKVDQRYKDLD